jgi:hypothetical protein
MPETRHVGLDEVAKHFEHLEDPRCNINLRYPLVSGVVIALMAILAGANGPTAIAAWALLKQEFLWQALPLPGGIPRKDVFRRVLTLLKPAAFQACFANWVQSLRLGATEKTGVTQPVFASDGKTARHRGDPKHGLGSLHAVTVWASELGVGPGRLC